MRHRVFIAINLPEDIKKQLSFYRSKWLELPCRWTKKENLHITLFFLGYLTDEELLEVCKIAKEAVSRHSSFSIDLNKICYGPPKKIPPRMVWAEGTCIEVAEGRKIDKLSFLEKDLENSLLTSSVMGVEKENRPYVPHITLGRIKNWDFRTMEPEERPEIEEEISLSFEVNSIEIMESKLKPQGPDYFILESMELGEK